MPVPDIRSLIRHTTVLPRLLGNEPAQQLILASNRSDFRRQARAAVRKTAGVSLPDIEIELKPNCAYMLVVSLGSYEFYGQNENSDNFPEESFKVVYLPEPYDGKTHWLKLARGIPEMHHTFTDYGAVYRHHKTEIHDNTPRSGEIVWDSWNPEMHRGEVLLELPLDNWSRELALHERGIPLMWSQGSGVPLDFCTRCGFGFNLSKKSRCKHWLLSRHMIPEDGIPTGLWCSDGLFYDMSFVDNNPAAKIACGLRKVAETEDEAYGANIRIPGSCVWKAVVPAENSRAETTRIHGLRLFPPHRILHALLSAEASVMPGEPEAFRDAIYSDFPYGRDRDFVDLCSKQEPEELISVLSRKGIMLTPTQWWRIFAPSGEPTGVSGFLRALRGVYLRVSEELDSDFLEDASYLPARSPGLSLLRRFDSVEPIVPPGRMPVLVIKQAESESAGVPSLREQYMAREYARYQTSFLVSSGGPSLAPWCALVNAAGL